MRALTIRQPWAQLIVSGRKRIETRSWGTDHRGRLAIHAGKAWPLEARMIAEQLQVDVGVPRGAVVAIAELVMVIPTEEVPEPYRELRFGDFRPGRFAWILEHVRPLEDPVRVKGRLGLWWWEEPTA